INYFVGICASKMNLKMPKIEDSYVEAFMNRVWKGNVRELKNIVERSLILMDGGTLTQENLPYDFLHQENIGSSGSSYAMQEVEKNHIRKVLIHTHGNKAEAARLLGIGIATLYRKIEEYQL